MTYWEILLNDRNGSTIFVDTSLENPKMEGSSFIVTANKVIFLFMRAYKIYVTASARSTWKHTRFFCWSTVLLTKHEKQVFFSGLSTHMAYN